MPYTKNSWAKGDVITAAKLNNIESGIANISVGVDELKEEMTTVTTSSQEAAAAAKRNSEALTNVQATLAAIQTNLTGITDRANGNTASIIKLAGSVEASAGSISSLGGVTTELRSAVAALSDQVKNMKFTNATAVILTPESAAEDINTPSEDIIVTWSMPLTGVVQAISGKNVSIESGSIESSRLNVKASSDCYLSNIESTGELAKSVSNAAISVNGVNGLVKIENCDLRQKGYNAIEIGLNAGTAKNVIIDGVHFSGQLSNNAILIFGSADNGVVTISNCIFDDCSNPIRISNKNNVHLTVNVVNCQFKKWESNPDYAGCFIFQDYTSTTAEMAASKNLFAPEKITINMFNCIGPNNTPMVYTGADYAAILGSKDAAKQIAYVYRSKGGLVPYIENENAWPTFNFA